MVFIQVNTVLISDMFDDLRIRNIHSYMYKYFNIYIEYFKIARKTTVFVKLAQLDMSNQS